MLNLRHITRVGIVQMNGSWKQVLYVNKQLCLCLVLCMGLLLSGCARTEPVDSRATFAPLP